jgi:hypothetical protein
MTLGQQQPNSTEHALSTVPRSSPAANVMDTNAFACPAWDGNQWGRDGDRSVSGQAAAEAPRREPRLPAQ